MFWNLCHLISNYFISESCLKALWSSSQVLATGHRLSLSGWVRNWIIRLVIVLSMPCETYLQNSDRTVLHCKYENQPPTWIINKFNMIVISVSLSFQHYKKQRVQCWYQKYTTKFNLNCRFDSGPGHVTSSKNNKLNYIYTMKIQRLPPVEITDMKTMFETKSNSIVKSWIHWTGNRWHREFGERTPGWLMKGRVSKVRKINLLTLSVVPDSYICRTNLQCSSQTLQSIWAPWGVQQWQLSNALNFQPCNLPVAGPMLAKVMYPSRPHMLKSSATPKSSICPHAIGMSCLFERGTSQYSCGMWG